MEAYTDPGQQRQAKNLPGAAPASSVEQELLSSRTEFRTIERLLLSSNPASPAGLLVCQFGLVLARLQAGIPIGRDAVLSLLCAAGKVARREKAA